jgi:hypothetical protein
MSTDASNARIMTVGAAMAPRTMHRAKQPNIPNIRSANQKMALHEQPSPPPTANGLPSSFTRVVQGPKPSHPATTMPPAPRNTFPLTSSMLNKRKMAAREYTRRTNVKPNIWAGHESRAKPAEFVHTMDVATLRAQVCPSCLAHSTASCRTSFTGKGYWRVLPCWMFAVHAFVVVKVLSVGGCAGSTSVCVVQSWCVHRRPGVCRQTRGHIDPCW